MSTLGDLPVSMAILGLLVEQPDTGSGLGARLDARFPRGAWPRNAVHGALPGLLREDAIRVVSQHPSDKRSLHGYEATDCGVAKLRDWIRTSVTLPPSLRDELQGKLLFATEDDLRVLVGELSILETACVAEYAAARNRRDQASRLRQRLTKQGRPPGWAMRIREVQLADEAIVWGQRVKRLQELREHIEDLLQEVDGGAGLADD
jgi:DNA-binding PadR family transcriptional regulator